MTGLNVQRDSILSISCFITDSQINLYDTQGFDAIIHHDQATLDSMDEWCIQTHGRSGLTAASLSSDQTPQQTADNLLEYIQRYVPKERTALLAGNSVHFDKEFLRKGPYQKVIDYLHYRIFDVSTIKEAARRWAPQEILAQIPPKNLLHQAKEDILESIEEAKFYRDTFFANQVPRPQ